MERFRIILQALLARAWSAFASCRALIAIDASIQREPSTASASLRRSHDFRRRLTLALFLLMSSPWLSTVAHADAASCIALRNYMNSESCAQGQLNAPANIIWYCYAAPYPPRPGWTAVYSYGYEIYNGTWDNYGTVAGFWDCSIDPVANVGSGDMTDGGLGGPSCGCDNSGNPAGSPNVGDPINASTGNKYAQEDDFLDTAGLTLRRFYNSFTQPTTNIGVGWTHSFNRSLRVAALTSHPLIQAFRPDGKTFVFSKANGAWTPSIKTPDQLTETDNASGAATSYTLFVAAQRLYETYDTNGVLQSIKDQTGQGDTLTYSTATTPTTIAPKAGLLITVTNPQGRQLNFIYNSSSQVTQVTRPDGRALTYTYDSNGNLSTVQYPDGKTRQYVYNESSLTGGTNLPNAMTGVVDETSNRYANTSYNSNGLATSTGFAGNVGTTQITYNSDSSATVQYPLGLSTTLQFNSANGAAAVGSLSQSCGPQCNQAWKTRTYDTNGYPASYTDFNGNQVQTTYDTNDLLAQEIDAPSTANQRTVAMTWNSALRVPLTRTVTNAGGTVVASTQWVYNGSGKVLARCEIDPTNNSAASGYSCANTGTVPAGVRRWTYTYCTAVDTMQCPLIGLVLTVTGPRTDSTQTGTYSYYLSNSAANCGTPGAACYQAGDLHTVTDAAGHVTTMASYDGAGRITRITDTNGINTDFTYTPRGWLASRNVGGATTSFTYTAYGAVQTVTDPDGVTMTYGYDAAHRLVKITHSSGDYVQYTLDAAGDKTAEQAYDANGNAHKSLSRTFNTLGQLTKVMDGLNRTIFDASTSNSYDANGNLVQSADGLGIQRQLGYDALNRLTQTLDNYNGTN